MLKFTNHFFVVLQAPMLLGLLNKMKANAHPFYPQVNSPSTGLAKKVMKQLVVWMLLVNKFASLEFYNAVLFMAIWQIIYYIFLKHHI